MKTIIYIDMDGVLANLFNHVGELHDVDHYNDMTDQQWEDFFRTSDAYQLFAGLPAFPTSNDLVQTVKDMFGGYRILSSPLSYDKAESIHGKRDWLATHITVPADELVFDHEKFKYAKQADGTPNVLIDDWGVNIRKWEEAGGIAIKYQADEDSLESLKAKLSEVFDK